MKLQASRLLLILFLPWIASTVSATSCAEQAFLDTAEFGNVEHIIAFRVLDYEGDADISPTYMDIEVTREFKGELSENQIRVFGNDNGMSVRPWIADFDQETEWVQALQIIDGKYYLPGCSTNLTIENDEIVGYIRPCSNDSQHEYYCGDMTFENREAFQTQRMTYSEFYLAMSIYSDGVAKALRLCTGPYTRCDHIRGKYDPQTGLLELPAIDIMPRPGDFPLTYGASATFQQESGSPTLFRLIEFEK